MTGRWVSWATVIAASSVYVSFGWWFAAGYAAMSVVSLAMRRGWKEALLWPAAMIAASWDDVGG